MSSDELTLTQAAALLGVTRHRVHGMIRQGQIRAEQRSSPYGTPYLVVSRRDLNALMAARSARAAGIGDKRPGPRPRSAEERLLDRAEAMEQEIRADHPMSPRDFSEE